MSNRGSSVRFVLTIDTEADNQWDHGAPLCTENVLFWEPFQSLCERHQIKPTYLVTSEIAADKRAQRLLKAWHQAGTAEVGAHLHAWTTPPFDDVPGYRLNDPDHAFLTELPDRLVTAKIEALTEEIRRLLGIAPTSFRAGRFGFDVRCAQALADLGYIVDTSVTPMWEWSKHRGLSGGSGGPDFTSHTPWPFVIAGSGTPGLVEVPVTILNTYPLLDRPAFMRLYHTLPIRAVRKLLLRRWLCPQPVWLRPTPEFRLRDLQRAWSKWQRTGAPVAVMMFHSSELMPGGSPYRPTPASIAELLRLLGSFFAHIVRSGAVPMTLTNAALELRAQGLQERRL